MYPKLLNKRQSEDSILSLIPKPVLLAPVLYYLSLPKLVV